MIKQTSMKFSGETHTFTKADVQNATQGVKPERISRYYVKLHGKQYPPKQVIRLVTRTRKQFDSVNARSALTRHGFVIRAKQV